MNGQISPLREKIIVTVCQKVANIFHYYILVQPFTGLGNESFLIEFMTISYNIMCHFSLKLFFSSLLSPSSNVLLAQILPSACEQKPFYFVAMTTLSLLESI